MKFKNHIILLLSVLSLNYADLIAPFNGDNLRSVHILFEWDQEPDATTYNLQISNSESFNNILLDINEPTTVYIEKDIINWNSNYYWRVRPVYSSGGTVEWGSFSSFSTTGTNLVNLDVSIYNDELIPHPKDKMGKDHPIKSWFAR